MKHIYILFLFFCSIGFCQDTIQVAKGHKVALIFNAEVDIPLLGNQLEFHQEVIHKQASNLDKRIVVVSYNDNAKNGENFTDFTVFLKSGVSYSFILSNVKNPKKHTFYIDANGTVNNKIDNNSIDYNEVVKTPVNFYSKDAISLNNLDTLVLEEKSLTAQLYDLDKPKYIKTRCYYLLNDKAYIKRYYARTGDVALWFLGAYYNNNELYLHFKLDNREGIDYDVNFLEFTIDTKKNEGSHQKNITPTYL